MTPAGCAVPAAPDRRPEPPALGVVAADAEFGRRLRAFMAAQGVPCGLHENVDALLEGFAARPPSLVLLAGGDLAAPLSALRRLRSASRVPCVLLAGGLDEAGGALARDAGADDAADRAAPIPAVLARVRTVLRRADWGAAEAPPAPAAAAPRRRDRRAGRLAPLARPPPAPAPGRAGMPADHGEFDLVRVLVERRGRAVSRDAIARTVLGRPFRPEDRTVDNLVLRLRRKLDAAADPRAIRTVRGAGYMFAGFAGHGGAGGRAA